eukprot:10946216-Ditylum_brightwellii.AAC.1
MVEPTSVQVKKWKDSGFSVKYMQCDNAAWDTPQRNHLAELKLALLTNKGRLLMIDANIPINVWYTVCNEAIMTATLTDGLTAIELDRKFATRYMHLFKKNPMFAKGLCAWGEAGTVK